MNFRFLVGRIEVGAVAGGSHRTAAIPPGVLGLEISKARHGDGDGEIAAAGEEGGVLLSLRQHGRGQSQGVVSTETGMSPVFRGRCSRWIGASRRKQVLVNRVLETSTYPGNSCPLSMVTKAGWGEEKCVAYGLEQVTVVLCRRY